MVGRFITGALSVLLVSQLALTHPLSKATVPLNVVLCDRAGVSSAVKIEARAQVDRIVRSAQLQLRWVESEACAGSQLDRYVSIVIVPRRLEDLPASTEAMGRATLVGSAYPRAYVFLDQVNRFDGLNRAVNASSNEGVILGHAMAHELGHLLGLPHTPTGIMRPCWTHEEWSLALRGALVFWRPEVKLPKLSD